MARTGTALVTPIPGDPEEVRRISGVLASVENRAQEIQARLRSIDSGLGPQIWRGDAANSFSTLLAATSPDLTRLATSYGTASRALAAYATELAAAQDAARAAQTEAAIATEALGRATADRDSAQSDADRHAAAVADAQLLLDPVTTQDAERRRADAVNRETTALAVMDQAQQSLQAAQQKAGHATDQRNVAAQRCVRELADAAGAGIENRNLAQTPTASAPSDQAKSGWLSDLGHGVLDVAGLVPGFGEAADGINAAWYAAEGDYTNAALSAAAMIPFLGAAATAGKLAGKGSDVIARGAANSPAPHTPLAPQGGLRRHEEAGGHTLDPKKAHVGATDQQLLDRQAAEARPKATSSYYDRAAAEQAVSENIAGNRDAIQGWLDSGRARNEPFDWSHDWKVGRHAPRGTTGAAGVQDVSGSRVVLRPDASMADGYRIHTTYPRPG